MQRIVISTSSSGLDYLDNKLENLRVLRHHIEIEGEIYPEGDHFSYQNLADQMIADKKFVPMTTPQGVEELLEYFHALYFEGVKEVLLVVVSSTVSETYDNLTAAKKLFNKDMFIHIYDSRTIAYNEAILALEAANMMNEGKTAKAIVDRLDTIRDNSKLWMAIDDLSYFVKRKRLSSSQGFLANMLNIKPVLQVDDDGFIAPIERVRKIDRALELMCDHALGEISQKAGQIYIVSFGNRELLEKTQTLLAQADYKNIPVYLTSPSTLANIGPHGVAIGVVHDS